MGYNWNHLRASAVQRDAWYGAIAIFVGMVSLQFEPAFSVTVKAILLLLIPIPPVLAYKLIMRKRRDEHQEAVYKWLSKQ